jgi:hypothetical protein
MANAITLITQYLKSTLDKIYMQASKTAILEAPNEMVRETAQAGTYMIPKLSMQGLVNYAKANGFTDGDITLAWDAVTLEYDRGRKFTVDRMDNEESAAIVLSNLASEFLRTQVVPEVDAVRFARIASASGIQGAQAAIAAPTDARTAFRTAEQALADAQVDAGNTVLFCTPTFYGLFEEAVGAYRLVDSANPDFRIKEYNGIGIVTVPSTRFYSAVTLATSGAGGYSKATAGVGLNFVMMDKGAVFQITKHANGRLFSPDTYQAKDAWAYDYRIYHDLFVLKNKVKGIYVHKQAAGE